jgi:uncharacterized membrane protein (TIGR01666 family)
MARSKDYQSEIRRFISSQYFNTGLRVTACVIIPAWILYHLGLLSTMVFLPIGALFVGLSDNPGPLNHRRNGLLIGTFLNFIIVIIAGFSRSNPWLIGLEIIIISILSSLVSVFGTRASSIGLSALIIFILSLNTHLPREHIFEIGLFYLAGGLWYTLVSLSLSTLKPYRPIQQLLGECLINISSYLLIKAKFYDRDADAQKIVPELVEQQIKIHQLQEQLRTILFSTRRFISETTDKGRILTMLFRDSLDLFERAITSQQDYERLHKEFDGTGILETFRGTIVSLSNILYEIGLAVQEGSPYRDTKSLDHAMELSIKAFEQLRKDKLNPSNVEAFIQLRHVFNTLQDLADRIRRLIIYTTFDKKLSGQFKSDVDFSKFTSPQKININLVWSNLSLNSSVFRHALRLTIALILGYCLSLFFPLGHGYWILLTIATIIKPAYSLSKQRNIQRLAGTFVGVTVSFGILFFLTNNTAIFIVMTAMMIIAYSLLKVNYAVSIGCLTVYLILAFHFLYPTGLNALLRDRIIDTVIGSVIAFLVSYFVLPVWEYLQIDKQMEASIKAAKNYFLTVASSFTGKPSDLTTYKIARKEAFVTLANLSDTFQRMLSDPKNQQPKLPLYHQFVSALHMLTSHIASLSNYAQEYGAVYQHPDFQPLINIIEASFNRMENNEDPSPAQNVWQTSPVLKRVKRLIEQRKNDLSQGLDTTSAETRKILNDLVTITDQLKLIHSTAEELVKIAREIKASSAS